MSKQPLKFSWPPFDGKACSEIPWTRTLGSKSLSELLPAKLTTSSYQEELLEKFDETGKTSDVGGLTLAGIIAGPSEKSHLEIKSRLKTLSQRCVSRGVLLPNSFVEFFSKHDLLKRLRSYQGDRFGLFGMNKSGQDVHVCFLENSCDAMSMVLSLTRDGAERVIWTRDQDALIKLMTGGPISPSFRLAAESFLSFIHRASFEIMEYEFKKYRIGH